MKLLVVLLLTLLIQVHPQPVFNILRLNEPVEIETWIKNGDEVLYHSNSSFIYAEDQPSIYQQIQLKIPITLERNLTLQSVLYRTTYQRQELARQSRNLTRFQRIWKMDEDSSLISHDPIDQINNLKDDKQNVKDEDLKYDMHIPKDFHVMVVVSDLTFGNPRQLTPQHKLRLVRMDNQLTYLPELDLGQLYIPTTRSKQLQLGSTHNLTLQLFPLSYQKYLMFYSFSHFDQFTKNLGPMVKYLDLKEEVFDQMKEFLFQNPMWIVILYFVLSFSETFLKIAFIKSEFNFWKNIDKNMGISLKTLFFQLFADVVIGLYLYQYNANAMVIIFHVVDVVITLWKISRTYRLRIGIQFPFIWLETSQVYKKRQKIDNESIWYMNYLLVPLTALYLLYALYKTNWVIKNYYRFILQTTVAFIALFGFILMTPQLYINYKLKSVDHLNWRGLIYRFITTIIDDLFAFMVTMPVLRRVMYFRDDIIFLIYIYQRQIYKTDYTRKTLFTQEDPIHPQQQPLKED